MTTPTTTVVIAAVLGFIGTLTIFFLNQIFSYTKSIGEGIKELVKQGAEHKTRLEVHETKIQIHDKNISDLYDRVNDKEKAKHKTTI